MDMFQEQKNFLASNFVQPSWLNKAEWWVLNRFLHPDNPCEPQREPFIDRSAAAYAERIGISLNAARVEIAKALKSGLKKLEKEMRGKLTKPESRQLGADRLREKAQKSPYWAGLD